MIYPPMIPCGMWRTFRGHKRVATMKLAWLSSIEFRGDGNRRADMSRHEIDQHTINRWMKRAACAKRHGRAASIAMSKVAAIIPSNVSGTI